MVKINELRQTVVYLLIFSYFSLCNILNLRKFHISPNLNPPFSLLVTMGMERNIAKKMVWYISIVLFDQQLE